MTTPSREPVTGHLKELYEEESWEVGPRLARAAKAREDGYPQVAAVMEEIAGDEAKHLSRVVRLLHPDEVERDVLTNLEATIEADRSAAEREARWAELARQLGLHAEAQLFEALARDELDHVAKLQAALNQVLASHAPTGPPTS
jgi:rubrerythrin